MPANVAINYLFFSAICKDNRAPKRDQSIYALALCARFHIDETTEQQKNYILELQKAAFRLMPIVVRIPTNLFMFLKYCEQTSLKYKKTTGWGRMVRFFSVCFLRIKTRFA